MRTSIATTATDELSLAITYPKGPAARQDAMDALHALALVELGEHQAQASREPISRAALAALKAAKVQGGTHVIDVDSEDAPGLVALGELLARGLIVRRTAVLFALTSGAVSLRLRLI